MGEDFVPPKTVFEKSGQKASSHLKSESGKNHTLEPVLSAVEALTNADDWRTLLSGYSRKLSVQSKDAFAVFVVISRDLQFRWTTHQDRLSEASQRKYEELLPLNADFGDAVKRVRGPTSGINLIDEISMTTGCHEFTLFRGLERGPATLYLYIGSRRKLSQTEQAAFSSVAFIFDSIVKREFAVGEQLAHSARLSAAIELGRQIGDSALAGSFLNKAADTIQKKMGVDYVAVVVLDDGRREIEFAGMSESLTPLYDTPQSIKIANMLLAVIGQKEPLIVSDTENNGYRPLGVGVKWAALIPLETHSKRNAILILESKSISPYDEGELKDIDVVSSLLSDRLSTSISIAEKERKILLRNMLLEELLLLHRESDPVKIADESLSFIESVVPSTISVFYVLNESRTTLIPVTSRGLFAQEMLSFAIPIGEGIVGKAISNDKPELINDAREDLRAINMPGSLNEPESILVIPIKSIKEDIGVITLHRSGRKGYSSEDLDVIHLISRQLSTVMERANSAVEMRKIVSEKETESTLALQLADDFVQSLADESPEKLPPRILRRCAETAGCDAGMLFIRQGSMENYRCVAQRPIHTVRAGAESRAEELEQLRKECVHLANNVYLLEDSYKVEDACHRFGIRLHRNTIGEDPENGKPYLVIYQADAASGCEAVFVGIGYQLAKSKQLFRGYLLQKLLSFFELRYSRIHDRKIDSDELLKAKKVSYFKDVVYGETDLGRLLEKVPPVTGELTGASLVAIYMANYSVSTFDRVSYITYNGTAEPPEKMAMNQAGTLVHSLESRKKVVRVDKAEEEIPFASLFTMQLLAGKLSSMDDVDYVVVVGFEKNAETTDVDVLMLELIKTLSQKVRQLTSLNMERHRTGLLNLIDEVARNILKQGDFGRMIDAVASAAGHLVGAEYSLVGVMNASNFEWSGYYETHVPESIEKAAVKTMEKGEELIMNDVSSLEVGPEEYMPTSISDLMIFPVTPKESSLPPVFILLINKLNGQGFNDNDSWILARLSSNILSSIKTIEALKQETLMKKKAELKKVELAELLDGIEGGIIRLNNEGKVAFANSDARKMLNLKHEEVAPKLVDLLSDTDSLQVIDFMDSLKKGDRFEGTYTFTIEGKMKRISVSGKQILDRGRRKGTVLFVRDEGIVRHETQQEGEVLQVNKKHAEIKNVRFAIRRGFSYVISEEKPQLAFSALQDLMGAGFEAFVLSREHPSKLREKYELDGADLRWLTQVVGNNNLDPSKLSVITSAIISFLEKRDNAVIFIDGLEYLLANNNTIRVIAMLENVMQKVVDNGAVVIASVNRLTFEQKELAMISKMFEELDTAELKRRYLNRGIEEFAGSEFDSSNIDAND